MTETIVVREYSSEYQNQVIDLILHIQQDEYHVPITREDQPDLLQIESFYQHDVGNFWVALDGEKVVGTIALLDIGNSQVALRKMFVTEQYRGKTYKASYLLLSSALEWAKQKGIREIYLGTTLQFVAAHRFYEKNSFELITQEDLPKNFPIMQVDKKFYKYSVKR